MASAFSSQSCHFSLFNYTVSIKIYPLAIFNSAILANLSSDSPFSNISVNKQISKIISCISRL